ncbi:Kelch_1 domain-containing protein [Cephalotus follicularis]|uniref:Kelch_1 domain-containing protein n=1 Tax=Cephalotus follicularis TaxID=3775 RepID=A0A1Q3BRW1_CEPFO|nr:Kelch_1 domain-containing protein [Cephalotus follicularis]
MATENKLHITKEEEEEEAAATIHGDILEAILSHLPLIFLPPACHVSLAWHHAAFSSLGYNKIKPWLILHNQNTRKSHEATMHAYDPRSHLWIQVMQPLASMTYQVSTLRSSTSAILYMLSPSKFSFSVDPLHLTWQHVDPPRVWRADPVVALVGHKVVLAGGTHFFEDDALSVEMYDTETGSWDTCDSMPDILRDSAASTWLSVAVNDNKMYVADKASGVTAWFDPITKTWRGPYDLLPEGNVYHSVIGSLNDRLILVGLIGDAEDVKSVKMWEVDTELVKLREIGEMPNSLVNRLKGESCYMTSIGVNMMGDHVYIHNPAAPHEIVVCEMVVKGMCEWGSVRNEAVNDPMCTLVFTCSDVGLADLDRAFMSEKRSFVVKYSKGMLH